MSLVGRTELTHPYTAAHRKWLLQCWAEMMPRARSCPCCSCLVPVCLTACLTTYWTNADPVNIPVSGINIGPVHKRDVLRANVMNERGHKKFSCILAFDVAVTKEAREMASEFNVRIFTADIIYHLFDQVGAWVVGWGFEIGVELGVEV